MTLWDSHPFPMLHRGIQDYTWRTREKGLVMFAYMILYVASLIFCDLAFYFYGLKLIFVGNRKYRVFRIE